MAGVSDARVDDVAPNAPGRGRTGRPRRDLRDRGVRTNVGGTYDWAFASAVLPFEA